MKSVLFECHHLYYLPNFLPIMAELNKRSDYLLASSIPLTINTTERRQLRSVMEDMEVEFIDAGTENERQTLLQRRRFDLVVVANVGMLEKVVSDSSLAVMVYHGIGLKQSYYNDMSPRIDLRAVESEERMRLLQELGEPNLVLTGFTKLDPLSDPAFVAIESFLNALGLSPDRPTLLYAPTFYPSSVDTLLPMFTKVSDMVNVIIKLHGFSWTQKRYRHHSEMATKVSGGQIHLVPSEDYNIVPYYAAADLLISDMSSTLFEYLALDRPVIQTTFYSPRLKHRVFKRRLTKRLDLERASEIDFVHLLHRPDDLEQMVSDILENPNQMSPRRQRAAERYLYRTDGEASSRLVDAIEAKLKERNML